MFAIKAKKREAGMKLDALRKSGEIPAIFYGAGKKTTSISVPIVEFKKIWRDAGESSTVKVTTPDGAIDALIHEVQVDPVTDQPTHVDFLAIDMKKKIRVKVPLVFEGVSNAVKSAIGNLVKVLHEVEIEALLTCPPPPPPEGAGCAACRAAGRPAARACRGYFQIGNTQRPSFYFGHKSTDWSFDNK